MKLCVFTHMSIGLDTNLSAYGRTQNQYPQKRA